MHSPLTHPCSFCQPGDVSLAPPWQQGAPPEHAWQSTQQPLGTPIPCCTPLPPPALGLAERGVGVPSSPIGLSGAFSFSILAGAPSPLLQPPDPSGAEPGPRCVLLLCLCVAVGVCGVGGPSLHPPFLCVVLGRGSVCCVPWGDTCSSGCPH